VDADQTLRQFADLYLQNHYTRKFILPPLTGATGAWFQLLRLVERSQWESQTLHSILRPLEIPLLLSQPPLSR